MYISKSIGRSWSTASPLNEVTIWDSGVPPSVDELSEDFAGYSILLSVDYYSGYSHLSLDKGSRDYTAFSSPAGLVRMTRSASGVDQFDSSVYMGNGKVHFRQISKYVKLFLNDAGIKGPKSWHDDREVLMRVILYR